MRDRRGVVLLRRLLPCERSRAPLLQPCLILEEGETVTVLLMESGWGWATNESGQSGWVPLECLEAAY